MITDDVKNLLECIAIYDRTDTLENKGKYFEVIQMDAQRIVKLLTKPAVINNEVAVCDHHWLGVGDWDGYAMEQCTKCNLFREAN